MEVEGFQPNSFPGEGSRFVVGPFCNRAFAYTAEELCPEKMSHPVGMLRTGRGQVEREPQVVYYLALALAHCRNTITI